MTYESSNIGNGDIQFTAEERLYYRRPKTIRLVFDLSLPWLQIILGCTLFISNPAIWTWLIAIIIIAGAQHGLALISHEAAHRLLFPHDKRKNDLIATHLFAAPALLPFNVYRQRHLIHHRLVSQPGDTKRFYLRDLRGWRCIAEVLRSLSCIDYLLQARDALRVGKQSEHEEFDSNLRRDRSSILLVHGILFTVFTLFDPLYLGIPTYYFILWLWPLITVSFLFGKIRSIIEHQPPRTGMVKSPGAPYFMNTAGPMLRSVNASCIERLFLSKINFHYHGEHHLWPWISYQYLPEVHSRVWQGHENQDLLIVNGNIVVFDDSYCAALANIVRGK